MKRLDFSGTTFNKQLKFIKLYGNTPMYIFVISDYLKEKSIKRERRGCGKLRVK